MYFDDLDKETQEYIKSLEHQIDVQNELIDAQKEIIDNLKAEIKQHEKYAEKIPKDSPALCQIRQKGNPSFSYILTAKGICRIRQHWLYYISRVRQHQGKSGIKKLYQMRCCVCRWFRRPRQPSSTSRQVASKSPVYQGSATSPGRQVKSISRCSLPEGSPPQIRCIFRRLA